MRRNQIDLDTNSPYNTGAGSGDGSWRPSTDSALGTGCHQLNDVLMRLEHRGEIGMQLGWSALLIGLGMAMLSRARRNLVVQGG